MPKLNAEEIRVRDLNLYGKGSLQLGDVQAYKNIALIPLIGESSNLEYLVFEEALNKGLKVSETSSVPTLRMQNKTDKDVLMLQGEYVIGGRQNRMMARNIFMEKNFEGDVPVSCVEQGRWSYDRPRDRPRPRPSRPWRPYPSPIPDIGPLPDIPDIPPIYGETKGESEPTFKASCYMATKNICSSAHDQGEVWGNVNCLMSNLNVDSVTSNFGETYEQKQKDIDEYLSHFSYVPGSLGMVIANQKNGAKMYGLDIFDQSGTMEKNFKKLLGSYVLEAIADKNNSKIKLTKRTVNNFLKQLKECSYEEQTAISLGRDYKINGNIIDGSALIYESIPLYVSFGSRPNIERNPRGSRRRSDPSHRDDQGGNFSTGFYRSR